MEESKYNLELISGRSMPGRSKTLGPGFMRSGLLFMLVISIIVVVIISTTTVVIAIAATSVITIIIIIPGQLSALSFPELTLHSCYQELQTTAQKEEVQGKLIVAVEKIMTTRIINMTRMTRILI